MAEERPVEEPPWTTYSSHHPGDQGKGHFDPKHVETAYRGLKNIMVDLEMIPGEVVLSKRQIVLKWIGDRNKITARVPKGGVFMPRVEIGNRVKEGDIVGVICSPRTFEEIAEITSPQG